MDNSIKVQEILKKNKIDSILGYEGKYLTRYSETINKIFDVDLRLPQYQHSLYSRTNSSFNKAVLFFIASIISIIKGFRFCNFPVNNRNLPRLIYVSTPSIIVKAKHLFDVIDDVAIIYMPFLNFSNIEKHISTFKAINRSPMIGRLRISDLGYTFVKLIRYRSNIVNCSKELQKLYGVGRAEFINIVLKSILYKKYISDFLLDLDDKPRIWMLEHETSWDGIALLSLINRHRPQDISTQFQHGMIMNVNSPGEYANPITDYDFVCSEREAVCLRKYNKNNCKIIPIGCGLQSLGWIKPYTSNVRNYDVLILLTTTNDEWGAIQIQLLSVISKWGINVLLRFRPASKHVDQAFLGEYIKGFDISSGTTLDQDVNSARIVLTFSGDAVYECFRSGKNTVLIVPDELVASFYIADCSSDHFFVMSTSTINKKYIDRMLNGSAEVDFRDDAYVKYNMGCYDIETYKFNLESFFMNEIIVD